MPGKKPTSTSLQPKWQGSSRLADAIKQAKPKILIVGIGEHGEKTISQLTKTYTANIQTATITIKTQKTIINKLEEANTILLVTNLADKKEHKAASKITQEASTKGIKTAGIVTDIREDGNYRLTELKQQWDTTILINDKTLIEQLPDASTEEIKQLRQKASAKIIEDMIEAITTSNQENPELTPLKIPLKREGYAQIFPPTLQHNPLHITNPKETIQAYIKLPKDRPSINEEVDQLEGLVVNSPYGKLNDKFTVTIVTTEEAKAKPTTSLSLIAPQLANMETHSATKQKRPIDLDLHQMENF